MPDTPRYFGLVAAVIALACSEPTSPPLRSPDAPNRTTYTAAASAPTMLEPYASSSYIIAWGINDFGTISGVSGPSQSAVQWTTGSAAVATSTAPTVVHANSAGGRDVNSSGQIAGHVGSHAVLWTPNGSGYTLTQIGSTIPGAFLSDAFGINAHGQVVGLYRVSLGGVIHNKCFLWTPDSPNGTTGTASEVAGLGGSFCAANDINSSGQIAGASTRANGESGAFVHSQGNTIDLQPASTWSYATSINDAGQVAGTTYNGTALPAAVWSPSAPGSWAPATELGAPTLSGQSGPMQAWALDINDAGFVVGFTRDGSSRDRAFFWQGGEFAELAGVSGGTVTASAMSNMTSNVVLVIGGEYNSDNGVRAAHRWAVQLTPVVTAGCLAQLVQQVMELRTAGTLRDGEARSLLAKLDAASRQSREGKLTPARNLLLAFIAEVEALENSRRLAVSESDALTANANCAIAEL